VSCIKELRKYRVLVGASFGLQMVVCAAALYMLGQAPSLSLSWLATVPPEPVGGFWLRFMWIWFAANGLMAMGVYLSDELDGLFLLEVWRHSSFRNWLSCKLSFAWSISLILYGLAPLPWLLALHANEVASVLAAIVFLVAYGAHLLLIFFVLMLTGTARSLAFIATLLLHAGNVLSNGVGWPNTMQYFLIGEHASLVSLSVIAGLLALTTWLIRERTAIASVLERKD